MRAHLPAVLCFASVLALAGCAAATSTEASSDRLSVTASVVERAEFALLPGTEGCLVRFDVTNITDAELGGHAARSVKVEGPGQEFIAEVPRTYFADGDPRHTPNSEPFVDVDGAHDRPGIPQLLDAGETYSWVEPFRCDDLDDAVLWVDGQTFPAGL